MNDAQIKHMVDRFLGYQLPENFNPNGGISFERFGNKGTPHQYEHHPTGTNILDAVQAEAMVRHMVEGLPRRRHKLDPGACMYCDKLRADGTDFHPAHDASANCQSGKHSHCSCGTCF